MLPVAAFELQLQNWVTGTIRIQPVKPKIIYLLALNKKGLWTPALDNIALLQATINMNKYIVKKTGNDYNFELHFEITTVIKYML